MAPRSKSLDAGLLLLRVGIGLMFMYHGWPMISGGPKFWANVGMALTSLGVPGPAVFWGALAASSEFVGGLLLVLGIAVRPAAFFMTITMAVATSMHLRKGEGLQMASHAVEAGIVFVSLLVMGPGHYRLGAKNGRDY